MEYFIDIFTCSGSTGRSEVSHSNRATSFKACRSNHSASVFFLTCCLHRICFMIPFFICLFPNSSFSGHSRNPPVSLFNYGFSCMHGQKYIRDTALRHEVNLKAGPKISQESQRALQEYFQHPRHASPQGLSCTAGSNRFWSAVKNVLDNSWSKFCIWKELNKWG